MSRARVALGFLAAALAPGAVPAGLVLAGLLAAGTPAPRVLPAAFTIFVVISAMAVAATLAIGLPAFLLLRRRIDWARAKSAVAAGALVGAAAGAAYVGLGAFSFGWKGGSTLEGMAEFAIIMAPFGGLGGLVFWWVAASRSWGPGSRGPGWSRRSGSSETA